jgi:hypothetical protein
MPENSPGENVMIRICAVAVFALGFAGPALAADPSVKDFAARTEIYDIHTLTLSDKQFLTGDAEAKATTISGKLRVAQGEGRLPVVVLMHGSGGMATTSNCGSAPSTPWASRPSRSTASPAGA